MVEKRIILFGASTMAGFWDVRGGWFSRLREEVDRYQLGSEDNHYQFYNCSISGDTSEGLRKRIETELEARDEESKEIITLISIGGNDAKFLREKGRNDIGLERFENNFEKILAVADRISDEILVISGKPMNWDKTDPCEWDETISYRKKDIEKYEDRKKKICRENGIPYIDLLKEIDEEAFRDKLEDGVHPDSEGHKCMKDIIKSELQRHEIIPESV